MIKALQTKLKYARYITWGSYFLFFLSMITGGYLSGVPVSLLLIVSLPLILFLPGMARENDKSLSMLCFVSLLYFIPMVTNVMAPDWDFFDVTSLILISTLFVASMMFSRWKKYERAGLGEP